MTWFGRLAASGSELPTEPDRPSVEERSAPGIAALFESMTADGGHCILDLGAAEGRRLRLLSSFARTVRFADLVPFPPSDTDFDAALDRMGQHPGDGYDVVLGWDVLDHLEDPERVRLVQRIVEVTRPGARLHVLADASESATTRPVRTSLLDLGRLTVKPAGPPQAALPRLLPRQVERLLDPFEVMSAFSLRGGFREYVAERRG